ncbi:MAG: UvrD-helicase domain-containing protein [bacterium JZ-2024 1]
MNFVLRSPSMEQEEILRQVEAGRSVVIVAGAGTGKTTTLLHIYRALLKKFSPAQIVAITFTEKAAAELTNKIRALMTAEANSEQLQGMLVALSDAPIGTIHSFCARLAREYPEAAHLPPDFVILDEVASLLFEDRLLTRFVNDLLSEDPPEPAFLALLEHKDYRPSAVRDLIRGTFSVLRRKHIRPQDISRLYTGDDPAQISAGGTSSKSGQQDSIQIGSIIISLAERFRKIYEEWRNENGYVDYEDLLEGASRVVQDPALARRLAKSFPAILVDEYQDTDNLQDFIIQRIKEAGSQVIVVGDALQSIYAFRGAEVRLFQNLIEHGHERGFARCALSVNYRSGQPILDFVNHTLESARALPCTPKRPSGRKKNVATSEDAPVAFLADLPYHKLKAGDPSREGRVIVIPRAKPRGLALDRAREAEADDLPRLCRWISSEFGIPLGEIAVLFRKFTSIWTYTSALESAGVPYVAYSGSGLFETQEIMDVVSLLRWIADPADRISEASVLRSLFCGMDDASLLAWFQAGGDFRQPPLLADGWEDAIKIAADVCRWRERALVVSPATLVQEIISETHYIARLLRLPGGLRRAGNLSAFLDYLIQLEGQLGWTFREMVEFVSRLSRESTRGSAPPLDIEDPDTVKLLTAHAAKGLEFDAVVLADTLGITPRADTPKYARIGEVSALFFKGLEERSHPDLNALWEQISVSEAQENLRLLYVAMTRARCVLAINWYVQYDTREFNPNLAEDFSRILSMLHGSKDPDFSSNEFQLEWHEHSSRLVSICSEIPDVKPQIAETREPWKGVDVQHRVGWDMARSQDSVRAVSEIREDREPAAAPYRRLGEALHTALRRWLLLPHLSEVVGAVADEFHLSEAEQVVAYTILARFAESDVARWIREWPSQAEVEIFGCVRGRWWSGRADLVVFAPDEIRVVDYKLSVNPETAPAYSDQVLIYAELLRQRFRDKRVTAYLYHLSRATLIPVTPSSKGNP